MAKIFDKNLSLIFGLFGKGKTYYTVKMCLEAYLSGKIIISNTWLAFPHIRYYVPADLPPILDEIHDLHEKITVPSEAPLSYLLDFDIEYKKSPKLEYFLLCDEGGLFFNNRNFKANFDNPKMLEMLVQPRKYGLQLCVITQDLNMLDKNFIRLSQEIVEMTVFLWFFRRAYSYDKKYINLENDIWNPDTPVLAKKTWLHNRQISIDNNKYFGGLYFTREILGIRAKRSKNGIYTIEKYRELNNGPNTKWELSYNEKFSFFLKEKNIFADTKYAKKAYEIIKKNEKEEKKLLSTDL